MFTRFRHTALAALMTALIPITAHAQGAFLFGMVAGGMLFGGHDQYGGSAATILYSADEQTLKKINPLTVRMVSIRGCFQGEYSRKWFKKGRSVGELFAEVTADMPKKNRTILQIVRLFEADNSVCAGFWFTYVEK